MALPTQTRVRRGREGDAYSSSVASRHSPAARTSSLIRYTPLPQSELMRDATLADLAQISGRETVATQQNSPNLHWRSLV